MAAAAAAAAYSSDYIIVNRFSSIFSVFLSCQFVLCSRRPLHGYVDMFNCIYECGAAIQIVHRSLHCIVPTEN